MHTDLMYHWNGKFDCENQHTTRVRQGRPKTSDNHKSLEQKVEKSDETSATALTTPKMTHGDHGHRGEPPDEGSRAIKEKTSELAEWTRQCPHSAEDRA